MNTVTVHVRAEGKTYSVPVDLVEYREYFDELQSNGGNPHLANTTFEQYMAPVKTPPVFSLRDLTLFNGTHFLFGWVESLFQSKECPHFIRVAKSVEIEVVHS